MSPVAGLGTGRAFRRRIYVASKHKAWYNVFWRTQGEALAAHDLAMPSHSAGLLHKVLWFNIFVNRKAARRCAGGWLFLIGRVPTSVRKRFFASFPAQNSERARRVDFGSGGWRKAASISPLSLWEYAAETTVEG